MARDTLICLSCRCEVERIEIARGRGLAMCVSCEGYADAAEFAQGMPLNPASPLPQRRAESVVVRFIRALVPRPATNKTRAFRRAS
jgi:hypothetical protein